MPVAALSSAALLPALPSRLPPALTSASRALQEAGATQAELLGSACDGRCPDSLPQALLHLPVVTYTAQAAVRLFRAADSMLGAIVDLRA